MKKSRITTITLIIFLIVISALTAIYYTYISTSDAKKKLNNQLLDLSVEQVGTLKARLDSQYTLLQTFSNLLIINNNYSNEYILENLNGVMKNSPFLHIGYFDVDGNGFLEDGRHLNISERDYFKRAMQGKNTLTKIDNGKLDNQVRFVQSIPIVDSNKVIGVLFGSYSEDLLKNLLSSTAFSGEIYTYLCDSTGEIILNSDSKNFLFDKENVFGNYSNLIEAFKIAKPTDKKTALNVASDLKNGNIGVFGFKVDKDARNIIYVPANINDWYIINSISANVVNNSVKDTSTVALTLLIIILFCSVTTILFIVHQNMKNKLRIALEHEKLRISEEEYRIVTLQSNKKIARYDIKTHILYQHEDSAKIFGIPSEYENIPQSFIDANKVAPESIDDYISFYKKIQKGEKAGRGEFRLKNCELGTFRWYHSDFTTIYDKNGEPLHSIISFYDVTDSRERELAYEFWKQSIANIPMDKSAVFEYNLTRDEQVSVYGNLRIALENTKNMDFNDLSLHWSKNFVYAKHSIKCFDFLRIDKLLLYFYSGNTEKTFEFKADVTGNNDYHWFELTVRMAEYPNTHDVKAYFIFEDINETKSQLLAMKKRAERDSLTNLMNRRTFMEKVNTLFETMPTKNHALIMIDLDNFKLINDTLGHIEGDNLLVKISLGIKSLLSHNDLVGRIGGDEFMICFQNISSIEEVTAKAQLICDLLYFKISDSLYFSGSLGISMYPQDGTTFQELYEKADIALYQAKNSGRKNFILYKNETVK